VSGGALPAGRDRRRTAANGRVAALELAGSVDAECYVAGRPARIARPVVDLLPDPDASARDRQLLYGAEVRVLEERGGWAFVQASADGYVGYVAAGTLGAMPEPTHRVAVPATLALPVPDFKRLERCALPFGAAVRVVSASGAFFETAEGWFVPRLHLRPLNRPMGDAATAAQLFFGAPYLWGGNTPWGVDCSGLVQAAFLAAGHPCPADSDMQAAELGVPIAEDVPLARGDTVFWAGHVGIMVDGETLLHANAYHMAAAYEPLAEAEARIAAAGGGPVTARRRVAPR